MTGVDVEALRVLLANATPGPWNCCDGPEGYQHRLWVDISDTTGEAVCDVRTSADAALIRAMHAALPALLAKTAEYEALVAEIARAPVAMTDGYSLWTTEGMEDLPDMRAKIRVRLLLVQEGGDGN